MKATGHSAAIPNPALEAFRILIGEWKTAGTHAKLPGMTLHGHASFQWIEGGAFLIMQAENDEGKIPSATAIFGSDNTKDEYYMLYFDERKVSRKCEVTFKDNVLKWWREGPGFSQRYSFAFTDNNNTMIGTGELSEDGTSWEPDLNLTYTRIG